MVARDHSIQTLTDLFSHAADRGDRPFLSYIDDLDAPPTESLTYEDFHRRARAVAAQLLDKGVRKGSKVALIALPRVEYMVALAGIVYAGGVAAPVNHHFKPGELAAYLRVLEPVAVVVDDLTAPAVYAAVEELSAKPFVAGISGFGEGDLSFTDAPPAPDDFMPVIVGPEDVAIVLHSSGTTGLPKAVPRTHGSIAEFIEWFAEYFDDDERMLNFLPLYHQAGLLLTVLTACRLGVDVVQQSRFSVSAFWGLVNRYRITHMNLVAPVPSFLLAQPPSAADYEHTLRWVVIAGRSDHWAAFQERFGVVGITLYGSTETLQITSTGSPKNGPYPREALEAAGAGIVVGRPLAEDLTEYRIVDDGGTTVSPGVHGQLEVRGRFVFSSYLNAPQQTAEAFTPDGWFRTGDIAYTTDAGTLVLIGRESGMIRRSGENISPREIEVLLDDHPAIEESMVVGVPDDHRGQEILARIVLKSGEDLSAQDVVEYLVSVLSSFKVPRYIAFHDHFDHTPTFKIKRNQQDRRTDWFDREQR